MRLWKHTTDLEMKGEYVFTTFHQSMDYEEFVEGLKPISDSGNITFEPRSGLFKEICDRALLNVISLSKEISTELEYDDIYDNLLESISAKIIKTLKTKNNVDIVFYPNVYKNLKFKYHIDNKWSRNIVSKDRLRKLYAHFNSPNRITSKVLCRAKVDKRRRKCNICRAQN